MFKEVVPLVEDTEDRTESFVDMPEIVRSFNLEQTSLQESSTTIIPMLTGKDP